MEAYTCSFVENNVSPLAQVCKISYHCLTKRWYRKNFLTYTHTDNPYSHLRKGSDLKSVNHI